MWTHDAHADASAPAAGALRNDGQRPGDFQRPGFLPLPFARGRNRTLWALLANAHIAMTSVIVLLLVAAYSETLASLVRRWNTDADYSHGFLVPLLSGVLGFRVLRQPAPLRPSGWFLPAAAVGLVLAGLLVHGLTVLVPSVVLGGWSLVMVLTGVVTFLFGARPGWRLPAAMGLLLFMVPLPAGLYARLVVPLQWLASQAAVGLLDLLGAPAVADGNWIRLPGRTLEVAAACSGLRQLFAFLALSAALAILRPRPAPLAVLLVLAAVPIAVAANVARVLLASLAAWYGVDAGPGMLHALEGLLLVAVGAAGLLGTLQLLDKLAGAWPTALCRPASASPPAHPAAPENGAPAGPIRLSTVRATIVVAILAAGLGGRELCARSWAQDRALQNVPFDDLLRSFPYRLGPWTGHDLPADERMVRDIKVDAWLQRAYVHPCGERVVLWITGSRRSFDQYHYPTVCMRGTGWTEERMRRAEIKLSRAPAAQTQAAAVRLSFHRGSEHQTVYYWYYLIGEDRTDRLLRALHGWSRALLRGRRNASLTVEVFSQSPRPDGARLDDFARRAAAALAPRLPAGTIAACDLGAHF